MELGVLHCHETGFKNILHQNLPLDTQKQLFYGLLPAPKKSNFLCGKTPCPISTQNGGFFFWNWHGRLAFCPPKKPC